MSSLTVMRAGPIMSVQDRGRLGFLAKGLSRGGALDLQALAEGNALLGQDCAAIEMMGIGGVFRADRDVRIALTGAPMQAKTGGEALVWNASHLIQAGTVIEIGACLSGMVGYLHIGGGIDTPLQLGARSPHLTAKFGAGLSPGDVLPLGEDDASETGMALPVEDRFDGGRIRIVASFQTEMFSQKTRDRFEAATFTKDGRATRMGAPVNSADAPDGFAAEAGLSILSDVITTGDIQVAGDGTPYVLMAEAQTTGGYPRIGTVIACDLPRIAQAPAGKELRFEFVPLDQARQAVQSWHRDLDALAGKITPLLRDPAQMRDLLGYNLISGAVAGDEWELDKT